METKLDTIFHLFSCPAWMLLKAKFECNICITGKNVLQCKIVFTLYHQHSTSTQKQDSEKLNSKAELNMQRNFHLQVYLFCTFPIIIILYFAVVIF